jgi:hypothetical protein
LHQAFEKYGLDSFIFEILEWTDSPDEREIELIKTYDTYNNGYNLTIGGSGTRHLQEEQVKEVQRLLFETCLTHEEISSRVGVGVTAISFINNGHSFPTPGLDYPLRKTNGRGNYFLTADDVFGVEEELRESRTMSEVEKKLEKYSRETISLINRGQHEFSRKGALSFPLVKPRRATPEEVLLIEDFLEKNPKLSLVKVGEIFGREKELISKINRGVHVHSKRKKYPIR